jgi:hypothetical protein
LDEFACFREELDFRELADLGLDLVLVLDLVLA